MIDCPKSFNVLNQIIKQNNLCDYVRILKMLDFDDFNCKKKALILLCAYKSVYEKEDLEKMIELKNKIGKSFKVEAQYIEEKAIMSSRMKNKWICICGQKNDSEFEICSQCNKDIYGFKRIEINQEKAIKMLNDRIDALNDILI